MSAPSFTLSRDETIAWLRLSLEPNLGALAYTLLGQMGLPDSIFASSATALARFVPDTVARQLAARPTDDIGETIARTFLWLEKPGHHLLTLGDPNYPQSLLTITDPPLLLCDNLFDGLYGQARSDVAQVLRRAVEARNVALLFTASSAADAAQMHADILTLG